ncbi:response regulator transcription factor [Vallitalea sp.]|jgi:DNA-binding response OmpR family regulator|uniref:response regulator transcription factor n=1 Tax=Vallitalea sp. TaxID=1882829 RepID=UPI0025F374FD|nr:response regulator transcription factor [Vallitalea sp.]MCT4688023.1 response regulator transcription factor [Vallitalea sp.]
MERTVLVIEDEIIMRDLISVTFRDNGFQVLEAADGQEALEIFEENSVDLVLLDIVMPKLDGWSVCRRIRSKSDVVIIMLTSRDDDEDQLLGFELGVDEYVIKPINIQVLLARSKRLLERVTNKDDRLKNIIDKSGITIDKAAYSVMLDKEKIEFAPKEYELLVFLIENEGRVLTREKILDTIWGYDYFGDYRVVDTHIKKIRKKLKSRAKYIHTVVRVGYKFDTK